MQNNKKDSVVSGQVNGGKSSLVGSVYSPEYLRTQTRWIRDELEPQVAHDGPDALTSDEVLMLDDFLRRVGDSNISIDEIRYSRIHLAIRDISRRATRWPKRLIDRCDSLRDAWEALHGPVDKIKTPLYEPGGRLHGICRPPPEDVGTDLLLTKWLKSPDAKMNPMASRKVGDLGFTPGDWWLSPLFAFRAGIIDSNSWSGGIVADSKNAYAIVMTRQDEIAHETPYTFSYRARNNDTGRYRLTAATRDSKHPIRVLRCHNLHSFWKPSVGIRYDGLYKVAGWSVEGGPQSDNVTFTISFKRLPGEISMNQVLCRPFADEKDDYLEWKRCRRQRPTKHGGENAAPAPVDGSVD